MPEDTPGIIELIQPLEKQAPPAPPARAAPPPTRAAARPPARAAAPHRPRRTAPGASAAQRALVPPLLHQGVLIKRPRAALAREVHAGFFYVFTRDSTILGCAMLRRYSQTSAELGCLVVSPQYRRQGTGDQVYMDR